MARRATSAPRSRGALGGPARRGTGEDVRLRAQEYLVRWDALTDYVIDVMEELKKNVAEGPQQLVQIPQQAGARGVGGRSPNPAVVRLPADRSRIRR